MPRAEARGILQEPCGSSFYARPPQRGGRKKSLLSKWESSSRALSRISGGEHAPPQTPSGTTTDGLQPGAAILERYRSDFNPLQLLAFGQEFWGEEEWWCDPL